MPWEIAGTRRIKARVSWGAGQVRPLDPDDGALVVRHYDKGIDFDLGADCRRPAQGHGAPCLLLRMYGRA